MKIKETFDQAFAIIYTILQSESSTKESDAFALALIKTERQARKIFTHLLFQYDFFQKGEHQKLRDELDRNGNIYFEHLLIGIEIILDKKLETLLNNVIHKSFVDSYKSSKGLRNKLFHGQITTKGFNSSEIHNLTVKIMAWSNELSIRAEQLFNYNGFDRNSCEKDPTFNKDLLQFQVESIDTLRSLKTQMIAKQRTDNFLK